jgi:hypothetical protein
VQQVARRLSALAAVHATLPAVGRNTLAPQPVGADSPAIDTPNRPPREPTMNHLPATAVAVRLNALLAAAIVTLTLLSAIATLAVAENAGAQLAQAGVTLPA